MGRGRREGQRFVGLQENQVVFEVAISLLGGYPAPFQPMEKIPQLRLCKSALLSWEMVRLRGWGHTRKGGTGWEVKRQVVVVDVRLAAVNLSLWHSTNNLHAQSRVMASGCSSVCNFC